MKLDVWATLKTLNTQSSSLLRPSSSLPSNSPLLQDNRDISGEGALYMANGSLKVLEALQNNLLLFLPRNPLYRLKYPVRAEGYIRRWTGIMHDPESGIETIYVDFSFTHASKQFLRASLKGEMNVRFVESLLNFKYSLVEDIT